MKKIAIVVFAFCIFALMAPSYAALTRLIDNFENNSDLKSPEWWKFDNAVVSVVKNPSYRPGDRVAQSCGKYSLNVMGSAKDWYVGGVGTYLGLDATKFTGVQLNIYGYGRTSGRVKIELYDDDKGSWETQYDKSWIPVKDDVWFCEQPVDWKGWKQVYIPFSSFALANPGKGDGKMNFDQNKNSGGLLQMQFIFIGSSKDGEINMNLDNISLVVKDSDSSED